MADIKFLLGVAFKDQAARGTATAMPAIGGGSGTAGAINEADGAVLGSDGQGVGDSGISFSIAKNITEKAVVSGSFTRNFANFLGRTVDSFQVVTEIKGSGITGSDPIVAADLDIPLGLEVLYAAAGFQGQYVLSGYPRFSFTPDPTALATAAIYFGNEASNGGQIIIRDVECRSASFSFPPGETGTITWDLIGEFDSYNELGSWPSTPFEYGNQASLSAPVIEGAAFTWGPDTPAAREIGFSTLEITVSNDFETVASSNSANGRTQRQTGRTISCNATIDATSGEFLYELDQIGSDNISTAEALSFTYGTRAVVGGIVNAFEVSIPDPELVSIEPERLGDSQAWSLELVARAATIDGEIALRYV
tara:strand:+ start:797 stop:1891 length:1095 start_codon:yes stop_codon:yes gene_type:complete